jgi:tRNA(Ile)-lysidine synthase
MDCFIFLHWLVAGRAASYNRSFMTPVDAMTDAWTESLLSHLAHPLPATGTLWVGFSGGLDSTVLLYLLTRLPMARGRLRAIHVNHGLSAHAADWQQHCEALCEQWQVPLISASVQVQNQGDGIEQAARAARYEVYREHVAAGDTLLLAHHGDDQIETFFQRLLRGSGLAGLAAMPAQRALANGSLLLRPLLGCERQQLEAVAGECGLRWVEDESNQDARFERNWWRNQLLPQLFQRFPGRKASLLRSVEQWQQDQRLLDELLQPHTNQCLRDVSWPSTAPLALDLSALAALPAHWQPYVIRQWLLTLKQAAPTQQWLQTLMDDVVRAADDAQPLLTLGDVCVRRFRGCLYLQLAQASDGLMPRVIQLPQQALPWGAGQLQPVAGSATCGLAAGEYLLTCADRARGHSLRPAGRPAKNLKALFQEAGIPPWLRDQWPALWQGDQLVALPGIACDQCVLCEGGAEYRWQSLL